MTYLESKAKKFATKKHAGQRYGKKAYTAHLKDVYDITVFFELSENIRVAAWLHDTLEDTDTTLEELSREFGAVVAALVYLVTDEPGENRKERAENTLPKTRMSDEAIALKLSDRMANVKNSLRNSRTKLFTMYYNEYQYFKNMLYKKSPFVAGSTWAIWEDLDILFTNSTSGRELENKNVRNS